MLSATTALHGTKYSKKDTLNYSLLNQKEPRQDLANSSLQLQRHSQAFWMLAGFDPYSCSMSTQLSAVFSPHTNSVLPSSCLDGLHFAPGISGICILQDSRDLAGLDHSVQGFSQVFFLRLLFKGKKPWRKHLSSKRPFVQSSQRFRNKVTAVLKTPLLHLPVT